jgi:hypothetical protein
MPTTLRNTDILFNDATVQTTAFTSASAWPGVYTGAVATNTAYPIGTTIIIIAGPIINLNATTTQVVTAAQPPYFWSAYGGGSALAGTWRSRGIFGDGGTLENRTLSQRVA